MSNVEINATGAELHTAIGMLCRANVPWQTMESLARSAALLQGKGIPAEMVLLAGSSLVQRARDRVVHQLLQSQAQRFVFIDDDVAWKPKDLLRFVLLSTKVDVLSAAYPLKRIDPSFVINYDDTKPLEVNEYGFVKVFGVGLGFTIVTRKALEAVVADKPMLYDEVQDVEIPEVFRVDSRIKNGRRTGRGEDMAFFADLREKGYDVWLDPSVRLKHIGQHEYEADPAQALGLEIR